MKTITSTGLRIGTGLLVLCIASVATFTAFSGFAGETEVQLSDVPAAVKTAIEAHAAGLEIQTIEFDDEEGEGVYDVEVIKDGEVREFSVDKSGKFLGFEEDEHQADDDHANIKEDDDDEEDDDGPSAKMEEDADEEDEEEFTMEFGVDKNELTSTGVNPYFNLTPGYQLVLEDEDGRLQITVLNETKTVDGVETRVVEEREWEDGNLAEVSKNFFAISKRTNSVFYFGEEVDIYENGKVTKHEGGWLAGQNGARFGLIMPGQVLLDAKYYQELAPGKAMDRAEIEDIDETVETPMGVYKNCLVTEETTPLEPNEKEKKYYAAGVGLIQEEGMKLVKASTAE